MAYTSWSVSFGEQPSATKWNILGTNDASFNDGTGIFGLKKDLLTTDSNPYKFSVYRNSAADTGNAAFAKITFDTEIYDTNSNFATGTYTAPVAGFYQFNARVSVAESHTRLIIALYKNGAEVVRGGDVEIAAITNGSVSLNTIEQSAANDTWEIYAYGSAALTLEVGNAPRSTYFSGFLVSRT